MSAVPEARVPTPAVVRDRTTWLTYVHIGLFGYFLYAFGPTIALLRDEQGYTPHGRVAARHGDGRRRPSSSGSLRRPRRTPRSAAGAMLRLGSALMAAGILIYTGFAPLRLTLLGHLRRERRRHVRAWSASTRSCPTTTDRPGRARMSEAHGLGATMGLLGPLAVGLGVALGWGWRAGLLVDRRRPRRARDRARHADLEEFDGPHGHPDDEPGHAPSRPAPAALLERARGVRPVRGHRVLRSRCGAATCCATAPGSARRRPRPRW